MKAYLGSLPLASLPPSPHDLKIRKQLRVVFPEFGFHSAQGILLFCARFPFSPRKEHRCPFGCFAGKLNGDSWFTWWFAHLPGKPIYFPYVNEEDTGALR